jgi:UDP-GlcNAc:undecaprenyl-phosphate GlcNAc-1-phosphate transferase
MAALSAYPAPFAVALALATALTPVVILVARRIGFLAQPREDRWHKRPTALLGGAAIFAALTATVLAFGPLTKPVLGLLLGGTLLFLIGLADDIRPLTPQTKMVGQIAAALIAVAFGVSIPTGSWSFLSVPLTVLWIVAVTNAVNILDNMDGLAAGIVLVSSGGLFAQAVVYNLPLSAGLAMILGGAALGFLFFNFHPAKIFMGDCGSLTLGYWLAVIAALETRKSVADLMVSLLVPLLILVVPLFDMTLVMFSRIQRGVSPLQGGRDHSSHRLVFMGFSERRAVLLLMGFSAAGAAASVLLAWLGPWAAGLAFLVVFIGAVFFGIALTTSGRPEERIRSFYRKSPLLSRILMFKKQMLQILADMVLIAVAYVVASHWGGNGGGALTPAQHDLMRNSLAAILAAKLAALAGFGLYRGDWRAVRASDLMRLFAAAVAGELIAAAVLLAAFPSRGTSWAVPALDLLLTLILAGGIRVAFRAFRKPGR